MTGHITPTAVAETSLTPLAMRVRGEFTEMPGLRLTLNQAAKLFSLPPPIARDVFDELSEAAVLVYSDGAYSLRR